MSEHSRSENRRPGYVAEYVLAPRALQAIDEGEAREVRQRAFDHAERENLSVTVVQRLRRVGGESTPTPRLYVTITSAAELDTMEPAELGVAAAQVIGSAFSASEWLIADVHIRPYDEMTQERAAARTRSTGIDEFLTVDELVEGHGLTPEMAQLVLDNPEMRKFFRADVRDRNFEDPSGPGIDLR